MLKRKKKNGQGVETDNKRQAVNNPQGIQVKGNALRSLASLHRGDPDDPTPVCFDRRGGRRRGELRRQVAALAGAVAEVGAGRWLLCAEDSYAAAQDADVLVLATEWNQFRNLDLERVRELMKAPVVVDLRNVYRPDRMREHEFQYTSVGR